MKNIEHGKNVEMFMYETNCGKSYFNWFVTTLVKTVKPKPDQCIKIIMSQLCHYLGEQSSLRELDRISLS